MILLFYYISNIVKKKHLNHLKQLKTIPDYPLVCVAAPVSLPLAEDGTLIL